MADARERAIERAQKLLRLASPTGGATEAERTSAALEAAKLIAEHGLAVATPPPKEKRRRERPASPTAPPVSPAPSPSWDPVSYCPPPSPRHYQRYTSSNWTESELVRPARCGACGRMIAVGETVWHDDSLGVRHYDITCDHSP